MKDVTAIHPGDSEAVARMKARLDTERAVVRSWLRGFTYTGYGKMNGSRMTEEQVKCLAEGHRLGGELYRMAQDALTVNVQG